jgi:plasmid stabilization system protein ParE
LRIRYTRPALADLEGLLGSISSHSPKGARRVQSRIQTFIELLADYPFIGARTDDPSIRRLPTPPYPYLIFYEVAGDEIVVHTVRHAARDQSSMPGSG